MKKSFLGHLFLCVVFFCCSMSVWGATWTWTASTAVVNGQGGKARASIYKDPLIGSDSEEKYAETSESTLVKASSSETRNLSTSCTKRYCKFTAKASSGYSFAGWFSSANGQGDAVSKDVSFQPKNSAVENMTYTFYAKFSPNNYKISFNANGGECLTASKTVTFDASYGELPTPTRMGYSFAGWFTNATSGSEITSASTVSVAGDQELFAHWSINKYTLTFDANGGSVTPASYEVTFNQAYTSEGSLPTPIHETMNFDGWWTQAVDGEKVTGNESMPANNVTIYAHWVQLYDLTITRNVADQLMVGESATSAFTFVHAENVTAEVVDIEKTGENDGHVVIYDVQSNEVIANNVGTAKIIFRQSATTTMKEGTLEFQIAVNPSTDVVTIADGTERQVIALEMLDLTDYASAKTGTAITYTSSDETIASISGNILTAHKGGMVTITATSAGTANYLSANASFDVEVKKRDVNILWNQFFGDLNVNSQNITLSASAEDALTHELLYEEITFNLSNQSVASVNNGVLELKGVAGEAKLTATYAGTEVYAAVSEVREVKVADYAMPEWQNDWTSAPTTTFLLYNSTNSSFLVSGKGEESRDAFTTDVDAATFWRYSNKKIEDSQNSNYFICNRTNQASTNGTGNVSEFTFNYKSGKFQLQSKWGLSSYDVFNHNGIFDGYNGGSHYEWLAISDEQKTYHKAAVEAIINYLKVSKYAEVAGEARDNLESACHATGNWTSACTTLETAIANFVYEYKNKSEKPLNLGFAMMYSTNYVKLLDDDAKAYTASWTDDGLALIPLFNGEDEKIIPQATPVLMYAANAGTPAESANITLTKTANSYSGNNAFYHTTTSESAPDGVNFYVLGAADGEVAFYKYTGVVPADKVVLRWEQNGAEAPARFAIRMEEEEHVATALVPIYEKDTLQAGSEQIYTIMGLPVSNMSAPGIYIQNGKKMIVR